MLGYHTIQTQHYGHSLLAELHTLQKQGIMCDVVLSADDGDVLAHKVCICNLNTLNSVDILFMTFLR